jgi:hypothetical protein
MTEGPADRAAPCQCWCHEQSALAVKGEGIPIHPEKCVCNGGTGWTDL